MDDALQPRDDLRVLVVAGEVASESALRELGEFANVLGVLDRVVRVLPTGNEVARPTDLEASVQADRELTEKAVFADWVLSVLGAGPATELIRSNHGFVEEVARLAKDTGAGLVGLTGVGASEIAALTELAHRSELPVLLARPMAEGARGVLVATSLADDGSRVFRYGAELARRLRSPVTVAHNALGTEDSVREAARAELEARASEVGRETGVEVEVVVTGADSPETGIVGLATRQGWQLLVLGSYPRSWLTGWLIPSVCAPVVERAPSSVLVLPLREP